MYYMFLNDKILNFDPVFTYGFTLLASWFDPLRLLSDEDLKHLGLTEPLKKLHHAVRWGILDKLILLQVTIHNLSLHSHHSQESFITQVFHQNLHIIWKCN